MGKNELSGQKSPQAVQHVLNLDLNLTPPNDMEHAYKPGLLVPSFPESQRLQANGESRK
ncbi:hypothetical protein PtB15_12B448 [Puccinia triticina]|nr:hypothetical protein PtB15_12B448 [Puccinia triticina]